MCGDGKECYRDPQLEVYFAWCRRRYDARRGIVEISDLEKREENVPVPQYERD